jgi:hypothetical protein
VQSCIRLPLVWRNIHPRSSGYPADIDSTFFTRYSACISCFIHVSTLFVVILHNNVVCTRHAVACEIKGDRKFTVNFERVRNWQRVFVVYVVLLIIWNYPEAPQIFQSVIQSGRGYQPIIVRCSAGRFMMRDHQLLAETENMAHKHVLKQWCKDLPKIWASYQNSSRKGNKQVLHRAHKHQKRPYKI